MLRACLIAIMAVVTLIAIWLAAFTHVARPWMIAGWAATLLLCLVFERARYKAELTAPPGPDWVATNEVEVDGRGAVRVWYHPPTGERAYVRDSPR